jgi:hypothetical protein
MASPIHVAGAALAALAVIIADVPTARAFLDACDVTPSRCQYGADGRWYFYPPGYRMPGSNEAPRGRAVQAPIRAAWGCGATDGKARGRSWGFPNRAAASYRALSECSKHGAPGRCRILSCSAAVHSQYEAHTLWFTDAPG